MKPNPKKFVPGLGFEPRYSASKADVLPLDDPGVIPLAVVAWPDHLINWSKPVLLKPEFRTGTAYSTGSNLSRRSRWRK